MTDSRIHRATSAFVREQLRQLLNERGFSLVLESDNEIDGWRAEFLGQVDDEDVILLAHKPFEAPFATLCLSLTVEGFDSARDCRELMDCASDFDVSVYIPESHEHLIHMSSRILISGVNAHDFDFTLNNLLVCREAVLSEFAGDEEA